MGGYDLLSNFLTNPPWKEKLIYYASNGNIMGEEKDIIFKEGYEMGYKEAVAIAIRCLDPDSPDYMGGKAYFEMIQD